MQEEEDLSFERDSDSVHTPLCRRVALEKLLDKFFSFLEVASADQNVSTFLEESNRSARTNNTGAAKDQDVLARESH